jgi:hypothetical protein
MSHLIFRDIERQRQRRTQQYEPRVERYLAVMVRFGGNLEVPDRPGYVYTQQLPQDDAPPPVPTLCVGVQPREDLRVWVERNREGEWEVADFWRGIVWQPDYEAQAYLPLHHRDHEWPDRDPHPDAVTVYPRALSMLRAYPGEAGLLTVSVSPLRYILDGIATRFEGEHNVDISGSQPAAGLARYVGIYLDLATNAIGTTDGDTTVDAGAVEPDEPAFPDNAITSALVRLDGSATTLTEADFLDLRIIIGGASTGANAPGWRVDYNAVIPLGRDAFVPGRVSIDAGYTLTVDGELYVL